MWSLDPQHTETTWGVLRSAEPQSPRPIPPGSLFYRASPGDVYAQSLKRAAPMDCIHVPFRPEKCSSEGEQMCWLHKYNTGMAIRQSNSHKTESWITGFGHHSILALEFPLCHLLAKEPGCKLLGPSANPHLKMEIIPHPLMEAS